MNGIMKKTIMVVCTAIMGVILFANVAFAVDFPGADEQDIIDGNTAKTQSNLKAEPVVPPSPEPGGSVNNNVKTSDNAIWYVVGAGICVVLCGTYILHVKKTSFREGK